MGYYIDLESISINEYKEILASGDLLPSQMVLKENIDDNFNHIKNQKIDNVEELRIALNSKKKLQAFSQKSGISEDYLKILIRNVNSYRQKPNKIKDFPSVSEYVVQKLENLGIKNTLQLFDKILTPQSRNELSIQTGISQGDILRLTKLTDLCRIRWVNHTFAYVLLETGFDTAEKVADVDYNELYEKVKKLNEEKEIFKGNIGVHDMKLCVEAARGLSFEIEY
jgi:hypothetical protein